MGFSSQAVIMGLIKQIYSIDFQINRYYQQKFRIAHMAQFIGTKQAEVASGSKNSTYKVKLINFGAPGTDGAQWSHARFSNHLQKGPDGQPILPAEVDISSGDIDAMSDRGEQVVPVYDPNKRDADGNFGLADNGVVTSNEPGTVVETKDAAGKMYEAETKGLNTKEAEIDQQLELLKSQRNALQSQRDEFTKYIGEGIKMTFKNNYA